MATPSLYNQPMNLPPLPVTPLPPPPSSSSPPPAFTVTHDQSAAASNCDTAVTAEEEAKLKEKWLTDMQGCLAVLATLVASVTYGAGVNVPGGFWQDDSPANSTKGHIAGDPVLADKNPLRYRVFFLFNANAFATSIVIIALLLKRSFFRSELRLPLLIGSLFASLISLAVAFCAGSARNRGDVLSILCMLAYACLWIYFWVWVFNWVLKKISSIRRVWVFNWVLKKISSIRRPRSSRGTNVELETMGQQP